MFCSRSLTQHVVSCGTDEKMDFGSDHQTVVTQFVIPEIPLAPPRRSRINWKVVNHNALRAGAEHIWVPTVFDNTIAIDNYASYLTDFTNTLILQSCDEKERQRLTKESYQGILGLAIRDDIPPRRPSTT